NTLSGMVRQFMIDKDLCYSMIDLETLIQRGELLNEQLSKSTQGFFDLRQYFSEFFSSAISVEKLVSDIEINLRFQIIHGGRSQLQARLKQCDLVVENVVVAERELINKYETYNNIFTLLSSARLALYNQYSKLRKLDQGIQSDVLDTCFVLMPFRDEFTDIYQEIIVPIFRDNNFNLKCYRADEIFGASSVMQDIWRAIRRSRILIVELTGRNPNVLYELGLAHVLLKPTILIVQTIDDVPFDLRHIRCIVYRLGPAALRKLREDLTATIEQILENKTIHVDLFED
ncbi:MAG TPA: hypothetical protein VEP90_07380, partial [Methylomirabilota bacterium]|nr:hypothetical protein [Methylomirabilota bacterium]